MEKQDIPTYPRAPLAPEELACLATFNAEIARGLTHTEEWRRRMAQLQARYDTAGSVYRVAPP